MTATIGDLCKDIIIKPDFSEYISRIVIVHFIDHERKTALCRLIGIDGNVCILKNNKGEIFKIDDIEIERMEIFQSKKYDAKFGRV